MFDDRYETFLADTAEARAIHHRLRYRIYCEERSFEPHHQFPDRQERDAADDRARHLIVRARATGAWVAAMRLILPDPQPFPIQSHCSLCSHASTAIAWNRCGEISRLGIVRNGAKQTQRQGYDDESGQQRIPEIIFGLFRAAYTLNTEHGLEHALWMSVPALARILKRFHLPMRALGEPCDFRGIRQPYIIDVEPFWEGLCSTTRTIDPHFHISPGYVPYSALSSDLKTQKRPSQGGRPPYPVRMTPGLAMA
ncbi:MAG: PEP-CTERM/exosortase system-associated acyltransferase [Gammaproteobacteria bacterium]|nr:PEP-CTERM/exosortase system-associated acyltransferase [Gammaproteobacteria bacterium]